LDKFGAPKKGTLMLSRQNLTKYGSFCLDINGSLPSGFLYAPGFLVKSDPHGKWLCCQCYNLAAQVEVLVLGFKLSWVSIIQSHTVIRKLVGK
jgi:hypothetical protein